MVLTTNGIWAANLPLEENDALNCTSRQVGSPKKVDQYLSTTGFIFKKGVELIAGGKINVFCYLLHIKYNLCFIFIH